MRPPCTAADSVTVNVMLSPSSALASFTVTVALSSLLMVPVPVALAVMSSVSVVSETLRPTVKVSSPSTMASSVVDTVKVLVSPLVPLKERAAVFSS